MPDISTVYQHLIGVSFLDGQENERAYKAWEDRFQPELSVWTQVSPDQVKEENGDFLVMRDIVGSVNEQGRQGMTGLNVVLAGFLDMRRDDVAEQAELLRNLGKRITRVGAILSLVIQFGFIGEIPSPNPKAVRDCVTMIAQKQIARLCMVAQDAYDHGASKNNWKTVAIMLDVMRRSAAPDSMLPYPGGAAVNVIGFAKYAEFNQKKLSDLLDEKERLMRALSDHGDMEFHTSLTELLNTIDTRAEKDYPVDGAAHPIHPGMIVEPGIMKMGWKKAKNGKDQVYNEAAAATTKAVEETARRMRAGMMEKYVPDLEQAKDMIRKLIAESGLGVKRVVSMLDKGASLGVSVDPQRHPGSLMLPFQENGCADLIHSHLVASRIYNTYLCKKALMEKLEEAFAQLDSEYRAMIPALEKQLQKLNTKLSRVHDRETYMGMVTGSGNQMETCFHPIMGGGDSRKFVLWREAEDGADLQKMAPSFNYCINKTYGSLKRVDDAQSKAVHVFFDMCSQESLSDLIN